MSEQSDKVTYAHYSDPQNVFYRHIAECAVCRRERDRDVDTRDKKYCPDGLRAREQSTQELLDKLDAIAKEPMTTDTTTDTNAPENDFTVRRRRQQLCDDIGDLVADLVERSNELEALAMPIAEWLPVVFNPTDYGDKIAELARGQGHLVPMALELLKVYATGTDPRAAIFKYLPEIIAKNPSMGSAMMGFGTGSAMAAGPTGAPSQVHDEEDNPDTVRMRKVITRLFAENTPPTVDGAGKPDETQAPAMDVHILLRSASIQFSGILSTTPEGTLKLLTPVAQQGQPPVMIEQFFDYADVVSVALVREVKATPSSRIITRS
jgi:hypothetical protein